MDVCALLRMVTLMLQRGREGFLWGSSNSVLKDSRGLWEGVRGGQAKSWGHQVCVSTHKGMVSQ